MNEILTVEGHRAPPSSFVKRLKEFDPNLRVVWGLSQAVPFPGWVIERKIPEAMKAKVYGGDKNPNRERFSFQIVMQKGKPVAQRIFDMMPDYHPVYQVMDKDGQPISELGEFVIDFLRKHYERTLLGFPELGAKHHREDMAERDAQEEKKHDQFLDDVSRKVLERRMDVWPEYFAHGGQPEQIKKGTEFYGNDTGSGEGSSLQDTGTSLIN